MPWITLGAKPFNLISLFRLLLLLLLLLLILS